MRVRTLWLGAALPVAAAAVLLAAAGCGGGGDSGPEPEAAALAQATPNDAFPLDRFHYEASLTLREVKRDGKQVHVSTDGDYESPDRHAFTYLTGLGDTSIRRSAVVIGDKIWMREGEGDWREVGLAEAAGLLTSAFSTIKPQFLGGPEFDQVRANVTRLPGSEEFVNDVAAVHYRVDASSLGLIEDFLGGGELLQDVQDLRWELWLAEDGGWPVRLLATATVTQHVKILDDLDLEPATEWELRVDITRPNDPAVTVEAPSD